MAEQEVKDGGPTGQDEGRRDSLPDNSGPESVSSPVKE